MTYVVRSLLLCSSPFCSHSPPLTGGVMVMCCGHVCSWLARIRLYFGSQEQPRRSKTTVSLWYARARVSDDSIYRRPTLILVCGCAAPAQVLPQRTVDLETSDTALRNLWVRALQHALATSQQQQQPQQQMGTDATSPLEVKSGSASSASALQSQEPLPTRLSISYQ